jgi:tartrate-resistant acid phosphatase type 5
MRQLLPGMAAAALLVACSATPASESAPLISSAHPVCTAIRSASADPAAEPVTVPVEGSRLRVLALGDFGDGLPDQQIVADAMDSYRTSHPDAPLSFGLTLGDNFYKVGLQNRKIPWKALWEDKYAKLGLLFFATLGNHDYTDATPEQELSYNSQSWCMPSPYYTFTAGPVQFFALNTQHLARKSGDAEQLAWLDRALGKSQARWKVVYGHHPILSNGDHGNDAELVRLKDRLLPKLKDRATLYLTGHDHDLQRLKADGVHLFIAGAGGHDKRSLIRTPSKGQWGVGQVLGFAVLEATDQQLVVQLLNQSQTPLCTFSIDQTGKADTSGCQ